MSKYGVFSGPYFPAFGLNTERYAVRRDTEYLSVFSPNAGKYGPEKTPYLDTFHAVCFSSTDAHVEDVATDCYGHLFVERLNLDLLKFMLYQN